MGDFVDSIGSILSRVERRVEVSAQNISNAATPGYKRAVSFERLVDQPVSDAAADVVSDNIVLASGSRVAVDVTAGPIQDTGAPGDLAIAGTGFFSVQAADGALFYTRQGQFQRDDAGQLVNAQLCALQQAGGGDLILRPGAFKVLDDGTVLQDGDAVGRVAVFSLSDPTAIRLVDGGLYAAPEDTVTAMEMPSIRQGALEASNVSLGAEMVGMMAALRQAQAGQRLMNVYDDLIGRAVTTFGQG